MRNKKNNSGVTLIEVIIAMLIVTIIALVSTTFFILGKKGTMDAKKASYALQLAEDKVEFFKSTAYSSITSSALETFTRFGTDFARFYVASELYTYDERYKVVGISITWPTDGKSKSMNLFTIIAPKKDEDN